MAGVAGVQRTCGRRWSTTGGRAVGPAAEPAGCRSERRAQLEGWEHEPRGSPASRAERYRVRGSMLRRDVAAARAGRDAWPQRRSSTRSVTRVLRLLGAVLQLWSWVCRPVRWRRASPDTGGAGRRSLARRAARRILRRQQRDGRVGTAAAAGRGHPRLSYPPHPGGPDVRCLLPAAAYGGSTVLRCSAVWQAHRRLTRDHCGANHSPAVNRGIAGRRRSAVRSTRVDGAERAPVAAAAGCRVHARGSASDWPRCGDNSAAWLTWHARRCRRSAAARSRACRRTAASMDGPG